MNLDTTSLGLELERFDYAYLLERALSKAPNDVDTREGSIIFDTLAPFCYEMAEMFMHLKQMYLATFISTAFDDYLDFRVAEQGLTRFQATRAVRLGHFEDVDGNPMSVPIGARFSTIDIANVINFVAVEGYGSIGDYRLECETPGVVGNAYVGDLLPISHINGLGRSSISTVLIPGQNIETDDELRTRFFNVVMESAFGGNVIQYRQQVMDVDGVGAVQVHPVWNGGGTVKLSVLDSEYNIISQSFINTIQELIDPTQDASGLGMAPIGHVVTVSTPEAKEINVDVYVDFETGWTQGQLESDIRQVVEDYFLSLRKTWDVSDNLNNHFLTIFRSQIIAAVLQVTGVANVSEVLLNGLSQDIPLTQTGQLQELPMVGGVNINEN